MESRLGPRQNVEAEPPRTGGGPRAAVPHHPNSQRQQFHNCHLPTL